MKYAEKYPDVPNFFETPDCAMFFKDMPKKACWACGDPTQWVEINFEAPLCSEECTETKWKDYELMCANTHMHEKLVRIRSILRETFDETKALGALQRIWDVLEEVKHEARVKQDMRESGEEGKKGG